MKNCKLPFDFYHQSTEVVARKLLGKRLVRRLDDGTRLSGLIVETEAYLGAKDRACHGYDYRRTQRTLSLFQSGGHSYVYLIYGMYYCFNVITQSTKEPEAVLIRAIEPEEGLDFMRQQRRVKTEVELTNGPGKLCMALQIDRELDRQSLRGNKIFIEDTQHPISSKNIASSPRIGVEYAGEAALWPLRFYLRDNPFVSKIPGKRRS